MSIRSEDGFTEPRDTRLRTAGGGRPPRHDPPRRSPGLRPNGPNNPKKRRGRVSLLLGVVTLLLVSGVVVLRFSDIVVHPNESPVEIRHRHTRSFLNDFEVQSLDGSGNNRRDPDRGMAGTTYTRVAPANYADGLSAPQAGPNSRYVSNRIFNDSHQNLFSEHDVTQWGFVWGQFLDHTVGLRSAQGEAQNIAFETDDPLETFTNTLGYMPFTRSAAAPGTGATSPREQVNTVDSYIDAHAVYSNDPARLEWLRDGSLDGRLENNRATLFLPEGYLPRRDSRGDASTAPEMELNGRLMGAPQAAVVAGDKRANENIGLQATHTLFAREHNRIVAELPRWLSEQEKFEVARRIVIAEQQYITYNEFLPTLGLRLPRYRGYDRRADASISNEFATVGYRAHSMIHGKFEFETGADRYTAEQLATFEQSGIEVEPSVDGAEVELAVPLNIAFFNPDLLEQVQLGPVLQGIGGKALYNNDEMIDNQLRSVMFEIPVPGNNACLDGSDLPECYQGVLDLGALDIERGRDHGMPAYNEMRAAYGLPAHESFEAITGEESAEFATDDLLTVGGEIDDPESLDFVRLLNAEGEDLSLDRDLREEPVRFGVRRTALAARLQALYGTVDRLDAFTGMLSEPHVDGTEFGELQLAMWTKQFRDLRDGDRFFYMNDPGLSRIRRHFGIDYRHTLAEVIAANTDIPAEELNDNVFLVPPEPPTETPADPAAPAAATAATEPAAPPAPAAEASTSHGAP